MRRLIDANALKNKLEEHHDFFVNAWGGFSKMSFATKCRVDEISNCIAEIVNAPTVDAVEVVHGWWIELFSMEPEYKCSECGQSYAWWEPSEAHYCPNCGADMRGDGNGK